ncbi:MAG: hypothetical protein ACK5KL_14355 [Dysgonomonas sp.]
MKQIRFNMRIQLQLLFTILLALPVLTTVLHAQVTIGSGNSPITGSLLDLKEYDPTDPNSDNGTTATKGFNLPRVRLVDLDKLLPMFDNMKDSNTYNNGGIDYPKAVEDDKHIGLMVYNLTEDSNKGFTEGLYYWNGLKWVIPTGTDPESKFFYMPSFILDTSVPHNSNKTIDLYDAYRKQFTAIPASRRNPLSKPNIPIYDASKLDYYITGLDDSVLNIIGITDAGILTYQTKASATSITYINVVFVVK